MSIVENGLGIPSTQRLASFPRLREEMLEASPVAKTLKGTGEFAPANDEALIVDDRSAVSPAQMVENKLSRMLKDASLPVSHLQMRGLLRSR